MQAETRFGSNLRTIGAIAFKDLLDAWKNNTILALFLSVAFMVAFYRYLPVLERSDELPFLVVHDERRSAWVTQLEEQPDFSVRVGAEPDYLERFLGTEDFVALGLEIPADLDARLKQGKPVVLDGHVIRWATAEDRAKLTEFFEPTLSQLAGVPIEIELEGHDIYPRPDSTGYGFTASLSFIFCLVMLGMVLVPHLMLEEKNERTMDALLVSPAGAMQIALGKAVAGVAFTLLFALASLILNVRLVTHWALMAIISLAGALMGVSIGLFLGSVIENRQQLMLWAWVVLIPMLLPPFLVALEPLIPETVRGVLNWVPTVALGRLFRLSFSATAPLKAILPDLAIVLGTATLAMTLVAWVVRRSDR